MCGESWLAIKDFYKTNQPSSQGWASSVWFKSICMLCVVCLVYRFVEIRFRVSFLASVLYTVHVFPCTHYVYTYQLSHLLLFSPDGLLYPSQLLL